MSWCLEGSAEIRVPLSYCTNVQRVTIPASNSGGVLRWDQGTGKWSSVPRSTEDVLGFIPIFSGFMVNSNMESWRSVPLKMRTSSTVTMWEDAESQCIESRPHGQKTEQKKVNFFTTYSVVIIRNMKMSYYKMCNTANNNIVGKKVHHS